MRLWFAVFFGLLIRAHPASATATEGYTPFYAKYFLVAGAGEAGNADGYFLRASFRSPSDLALSPDKNTLYVVDSGNNAVRTVALRKQDLVGTLCGGGDPGDRDGVGAQARLSNPSQAALSVDGSNLYILDQDGHEIRRLDPLSGRLDTLVVFPRSLTITCLAVNPVDDHLYAVWKSGLYRWNPGAGRFDPLGRDAAFGCPQGRLVFGKGEASFASPCDGVIYWIGIPGENAHSPGLLATAVVTGVGHDATGFCAAGNSGNWGNFDLLWWEPGREAFARAKLSINSVDYYGSDYQGTTFAGPTTGVVGINATADKRLLFAGPVAFTVGGDGIFYAADPVSGRMLGIDTNLFVGNDASAPDIRLGEPKPPDATRVLVVGSSIVYFWQQYTPEKKFNVNLDFVRQLETYLNLESGLQGLGRRYEVAGMVNQLGSMNGGTATYFLDHHAEAVRDQADEVLLVIDSMSLCKEIAASTNWCTEDDLATINPAFNVFASWTAAERYRHLGPLTKAFYDDLKTHPERYKGFVELSEQGWVRYLKKDRELFALPAYREFATAVMRKAIQRCDEAARAQGEKFAIVLYPSRDLVEVGEQGGDDFYDHINPPAMDEPLRGIAASLGIPCYSLTDAARLMAVPFYPLINPGDHHYNFRAQGWMAYLLARKLLQAPQAAGALK